MTLEFITIDKKKYKLVVPDQPTIPKGTQVGSILTGFRSQGYLKLSDKQYLMFPAVSMVEVLD